MVRSAREQGFEWLAGVAIPAESLRIDHQGP